MLHWQIEQNIIKMLGKIRNWVIYIHLILPIAKILPLCLVNSSQPPTMWEQFKGLLWLVLYRGTPDSNEEHPEMMSPGTQLWCTVEAGRDLFAWFSWVFSLPMKLALRRAGERNTADCEKGLAFWVYSHLNTCKLIASLLVEGTSVAEGLFMVLYVTLGRQYLLVMCSPVGCLVLPLFLLLFGSGNCFLCHLLEGTIPQELTPW